MLHSVLVLAALALTPEPAQTDSARALSEDELAIYRLTIRNVRSSAGTALSGRVMLALDPWIRPEPLPAAARPWAGARLSKPSLNGLTRATGILQVCEPVVDGACRGNVRGTVLRLPEIRFLSPDTAEVVLVTTAARSEFDNTMLVPQVRYYVYDVVREKAGWDIRKARRGLPVWRAP